MHSIHTTPFHPYTHIACSPKHQTFTETILHNTLFNPPPPQQSTTFTSSRRNPSALKQNHNTPSHGIQPKEARGRNHCRRQPKIRPRAASRPKGSVEFRIHAPLPPRTSLFCASFSGHLPLMHPLITHLLRTFPSFCLPQAPFP